LRKFLLAKSRGSVESFLTIIPQVFIFLIMFQLVFVQFNLSILLLDKRSNSTKFIDFSSLVTKKVVSIAIDEDERD
jgi:hypothetical protein